jgi:ubiquinone/menaquinone biosynthesis C-methylase UbiE
MKKVLSTLDIVFENFSSANKVFIDIGCGTGDVVRALNKKGFSAFGIDSEEMLTKANINLYSEGEKFLTGNASKLPVKNESADVVTYIASFHHIPLPEMNTALEECKRVLKPGGHVLFIEPVPEPETYYEILKLAEDEKEILAKSFSAIKQIKKMNFSFFKEEFFYMERSFSDYIKLLNIFFDDENLRADAAAKAREITNLLCKKSHTKFQDFRYKSVCRLNIYKKNS